MGLLELNSDLSGGSTQSSSLSAASLQTNVIAPNSYGLFIQPNINSQISSIKFDASTGWIAIAGNSNNNIVKQTITSNGYYQFDIDGDIFSSDRSSASFWRSIAGATRASVVGINFDGGLGYDTLTLENQTHSQQFAVTADDAIKIDGQIKAESIFFKAKDIINQGSIVANKVTTEFSNSYTDVAETKIIATDILLNGSKTGNLEATGQFLATGVMGGKIDLRGQAISLRGANLDASGENGGGKILIGGDYQGIDSGTLTNAESVFVDKYSSINANALTNGNGGKVIIWSDADTDFRGNITAMGGSKAGDGGFAEVSGKEKLNFVGKVNVDAINGKLGSILLDPADIYIKPNDNNDETFDVSDLQKLQGNVTLSATNSITFGTNAYFVKSQGTITLQSFTVNLFGSFSTGGRNLDISGASINGTGYISSSSYAEQSGYIRLTSSGGINFGTSTIFAESSGKSGNIILMAGTTITTGFLTAAGTVRGGNIKLSAKGDILTSAIRSFSDVNGGAVSVVSTEGNIDTTNDSEYGNDGYISSYGISRVGGSVTMSAYGTIVTRDIHTDGEVHGGNVKLSAKGDIFTSYISTTSHGIGGNVSLVSTGGKINTINGDGGYISTYGVNGNGGSVTLTADGDITTSYVHAESYSAGGKGGNIKLISQSGGIDTKGGSIFSYANDGNAGFVTLSAKKDVMVGDILSISKASGAVVGNGGKVTIDSGNNIETGNITTTTLTGNAGNVTVKANLGTSVAGSLGIKVGNIDAFANGDGNAGDVKLNAGYDSDIKVLAIKTNVGGNGKGDGGEAYITSGGNIVVDSVRADSIGGKAGNVRLIASKTVRVTSAFSVNGESYSIYTDAVDDASGAKGGTVTIEHSTKIKNTPSPFIIGDSNINGTFSSISDGVIGLIARLGAVHNVISNLDLNQIHIKGNRIVGGFGSPLIDAAAGISYSEAFLSYIFKNTGFAEVKYTEFLLNGAPGFTLQQLNKIAIDTPGGAVLPSLNTSNAQKLLKEGLNFYLYLYNITTPRTKGHFISQSFQETGSFRDFGEINSAVSGYDLGRGLLHLTGKSNYKDFGEYVGIIGLEKRPELVASNMALNILSAMWFWSVQYATSNEGSLNSIAQTNLPTVNTVDLITSKINNGEDLSSLNAQNRREYFLNAVKVLSIN